MSQRSSRILKFPYKYPLFYTLKGGNPVPVGDIRALGAFLESDERLAGRTKLKAPDGSAIVVSTVFTCYDASFLSSGPPQLWETTVFWPGSDLNNWNRRYTNKKAARAGHKAAVTLVKSALLEKEGH